ncbi:hypothetical protein AtubIFM56815_001519 [Aspergillus tubingensis]|uniref:Uncharacterized protein n=2 Tax=Aspergillus subgen. Circumdati TaxID=2720871 RepID=A0A9W6AF11_ASPTU|nr:similar to An18g00890 [Aspergillus niger]GLA80688.1 hypothetical protein AtubIFM56815_001519 [Aspergillus tubingensis]GLA93972.1 hypothetical protein AtubIFM57143_000830 [Aspergillus tubingensis]
MPASRPKRQDRPKHSELDTQRHAVRAGIERGESNVEEANESESETWAQANRHLLNQVSGISEESLIDEGRAGRYSCPPLMSADSEAFLSPEETTAMPRPAFYRQVWSRPSLVMRPMYPLTPDDSPEDEMNPKAHNASKKLHQTLEQFTTGPTSSTSDLASSAIPNSQGHIKRCARHQRRSTPYSRPSRAPRPSRIHSPNEWLGRMQDCLSEVDMEVIDQQTDLAGLRNYDLSHVIVSHREYPFREINFIMLVWKDVTGPLDVDWPALQVPLKNRLAASYHGQNDHGSRRALYGGIVVGQLAQFYVFVGEGPAQLNLSIFEDNKLTLNLEHDQELIDGHLSWVKNEFPPEVYEEIENDPSIQAAACCIEDFFGSVSSSSTAFDLLPEPEIVLVTDQSSTSAPLPQPEFVPVELSPTILEVENTFEDFLREVTWQSAESEHSQDEKEQAGNDGESDGIKEDKIDDVADIIDEDTLIKKALKYVGEGALDTVVGSVCLTDELNFETDDEQGRYIKNELC